MQIHGYAAFAPKQSLQPFSYNSPSLQPYEILVKITHSGLCHTDLFMIDNDWNRSTYPLLPGHEVVGTIIDKGSLATNPIGQRVGISWVKSSCLECPLCLQGDTNICPKKIGCYNKGAYGGFATHMIADSRFAYPIPDTLNSAHAAPLLCAGATVYAPLKRYTTQAPQHAAILGIGGLGHLALQFARALDYTVTALSSSPDKKTEAHSFGAHHFHTLDTLPPPSTFDLLLVTSDAPLDWNQILTLLKPNGTLCFVSRPQAGFHLDFAHLVSTQRSITGSNNAGRTLMNEMLHFAAHHHIHPQIELFPLSQINTAIAKLKANQVRYRVVLTP